MSKYDECYTPEYIFEALGVEFDLDPCAPKKGSVVPAKKNYSLPSDGLQEPWEGFVWCNPPYSAPKLWVKKWIEHANGMLLVLTTKSYWYRSLWDHPSTICVNLHPPKFIIPNDKPRQISYPVNLWAIGDKGHQALIQSKLGRVR